MAPATESVTLFLRRGCFLDDRQQFPCGIPDSTVTRFPLAHCALQFLAVEFTKRNVIGNRLNELRLEPVPNLPYGVVPLCLACRHI